MTNIDRDIWLSLSNAPIWKRAHNRPKRFFWIGSLQENSVQVVFLCFCGWELRLALRHCRSMWGDGSASP